MNQPHENFYVFDTDVNLLRARNSCLLLEQEIVARNYSHNTSQAAATNIKTLLGNKSYNVFGYSLPEFDNIFDNIKSSFDVIRERTIPRSRDYYTHTCMHAWLNCGLPGQFVDWHNHTPNAGPSISGVLYIHNTKGAGTEFRRLNKRGKIVENFIIAPGDGKVVFWCDIVGWEHRSQKSTLLDPRITIPFQIIPKIYVPNPNPCPAQWIPI